MANINFGLSGNLAQSGIHFNEFVKHSKTEEWKQVVTDATNSVNYVYDPTQKDLYVRLQISPRNTTRYSFQGKNSGGLGYGDYTDKDAFILGTEAKTEPVKWTRDELEFFVPKQTKSSGMSIYAPYQGTIPLTLLPDGACESIGETFEPPVRASPSERRSNRR
ncbi:MULTISPECIES: hypothetical protein [Bacteria]|uniref:hypothetical protein n=1 Tax=Bacteria TaxID=2 RepID=UPI00071C72B4|nr:MULTISPECIES: hypothetical protein [Bacteria]KSV84441.1 hypothetical protein N184_33825 [Sinorhizobium sp. GL28]